MKNLLVFLMLSCVTYSFGQIPSFTDIPKTLLENLGEMGNNDSLWLNYHESLYLNFIFENSRKDFDFSKKKIGFISGSSGCVKRKKRDYFKQEKDRYIHNYKPTGGMLYVFDEEQKEKAGGYDAAIVYWCKFVLPVDKVIRKLREK